MLVRTGIALGLLFLVLAGPAVSGAVAADATRAASQDCSFPYETTDATGTELRLPAEPGRVVTLNPSAAQTMWEIGAAEKVVGLTKYAGYLKGADSRANVSGSTDIVVVEKVVALEPDLVVAPNATDRETVEQLRGAGLTVYHFEEAESIEDVYAKTRTIGRLTGECAGAEETVGWMQSRIGTVRNAVEGESRPDVLYAFFGFTAGRGTFIHEVIETAGGNNVAADYNITGYRKPNPEVVVEADPDWIVRNDENPVGLDPTALNRTTAGRTNRTVVVQIEHVNQPAPRVVRAIETLAAHFHPEAYAEANATTAAATANPAATPRRATSGGPATPGTTSPGQPGFGVVAGALAVALSLFVLRGRS